MGASLYVVLFINLNYDNSTHKDRKIIDTLLLPCLKTSFMYLMISDSFF